MPPSSAKMPGLPRQVIEAADGRNQTSDMTQPVQTQEKQKPRRVIRIVLAALILLAVAVGFHFYRVVQLSPKGHLSRFVPRGFQLFLHASRFKDGVDRLLASAEWKQLAGSGKL